MGQPPSEGQPTKWLGADAFTPLVQQLPIRLSKAVVYDSGGTGGFSIAVGDLNGDGHADLAIANSCQDGSCLNGGVSILFGNGDGTFQSATTYNSGGQNTQAVAIGDLNGDGHPDLALANFCDNPSCANALPGTVSVLLNIGDGTFSAPTIYASGAFEAVGVTIADLNHNGKMDLVASNCSKGPGHGSGFCDSGVVGVLLGRGDGTFHAVVTYDSAGSGATSTAVADVNGDGKVDLVVSNCAQAGTGCGNENTKGSIAVLLGNGNGTFQNAVTYPTEFFDQSVALADVNGDGHLDAVVAAGNSGVLLGNGDGTFRPMVPYNAGGYLPSSAAVADMNGDGRLDLVVISRCWNLQTCGHGAVAVLAGLGDGTFLNPIRYESGQVGPTDGILVDLNGDHKLDVAVANNSSAGILLNHLIVATITTLTSSSNPAQTNQPVTLTASITSKGLIPDGTTVTFYNGTVKIGSASAVNGLASLTTSFATAGTYRLKATYSGNVFYKKSTGKITQVVNP